MEKKFADVNGDAWQMIRRSGGGFAASGKQDDPDGGWAGLEFRNVETGETRLLAFPRGGVPRAFLLERMPERELQALLEKAVPPESARTEQATSATTDGTGDRPERRNSVLREAIDRLLEHMRYVNRNEWTAEQQQMLVLANRRCGQLVDSIWRIILEQKHPGACSCELCSRLRVKADEEAASGDPA
jgi:hypothetical protein